MLRLSDALWPLGLATMAGLSTSIGALIAVVQKPSVNAMAALLGLALGVMATVSCVELVARSAMSGKGDPFLVLTAALGGALTYYVLEPMFPKVDDHHDHVKKQDDVGDHEAFFRLQQSQEQQQSQQVGDLERTGAYGASHRKMASGASTGGYGAAVAAGIGMAIGGGGASVVGGLSRKASSGEAQLSSGTASMVAGSGRENSTLFGAAGQLSGSYGLQADIASGFGSGGMGDALMSPGGGSLVAVVEGGAMSGVRSRSGRMLRLGVLMAITMTLHNLPEGFAVAFSAFTDFGPIMALAIALHNIPEGVIVAAPIYAATGSRWQAIGVATASGLSEPLGALLALLLLQPFFTQERLVYMLGFVGGVMLAVCGIELWPEGRNCRHDRSFALGIIFGCLIMGWTLYVEG